MRKKKRTRQCRVPASLLGNHRLRSQFTLALLNRQFARGEFGGNSLAGVSGRKFGSIGIKRCLRERATKQIAEPTKDDGQHLFRPPGRTPAGNFGDEPDDDDIIRNKFWLQCHLNCAAHIWIGRERHQCGNEPSPRTPVCAPKEWLPNF
jgi:hypothetical protein